MQVTSGIIFRLLSLVSRITFGTIFFRLRVLGTKNICKLKGPFVITPMHKSYLDPLLYVAALPLTLYFHILPVRILVKEWLFNVVWYKGGLLLRYGILLSGGCRLGKGRSDLRYFLRLALAELKNSRSVVLYPEGGIRTRFGISSMKNGAAFLARASGVPILPVAIRGIELLSAKDFFFGKRMITVVFGTPFTADTQSRSREITQEIRKRLLKIYTVGQPNA